MKKIKICLKCGKKFICKSLKAKWCSIKCGSKNAYENTKKLKECLQCGKEFFGKVNKRYCSGKCVGVKRVDHLKKIHEANRKYPKIQGLNRCQIFRKFNQEKQREELHRDAIKRVVLIQYLGGKCSRCGYEKDIRALQLDHIHSDGKKDRSKEKRKGKVYRYYVNHLEESEKVLQVLCANCHCIKTHEHNEWSIKNKIMRKK